MVPLGALSPREGAAIGTAGFTAAMSVRALIDWGVEPGAGSVVVTGASGGVGSVSVDLLAAAGYRVVASTGKETAAELLKGLGAGEVIGRLPADPDAKPRPLATARWAAAVDCVGGATLAELLPIGPRRNLWALLGDSLRPRHLDSLTSEVDVKDVVGVLDRVRAGAHRGRAVVRVAGGF